MQPSPSLSDNANPKHCADVLGTGLHRILGRPHALVRELASELLQGMYCLTAQGSLGGLDNCELFPKTNHYAHARVYSRIRDTIGSGWYALGPGANMTSHPSDA